MRSGKSGLPSNFSSRSLTMRRIRSETSAAWTPSREAALEVEQGQEELEVLLLAVVRRRRHQQEVAGQAREGGGALHAQQTSWRGLVVAPERRRTPYDDYRYPQSVEDRIVDELGGIYGPYTGRWFASKTETDIEHMVARSEAHDSGLCAADPATRRRFASDLLNLTLAGPRMNRLREGRPRRGRVAAGAEPLLVRGAGGRGLATEDVGLVVAAVNGPAEEVRR